MTRAVPSVILFIRTKSETLLNVAWAMTLCTLLIFSLESFVGPIGADSSTFMYVARGILEGEVPYLDRWDNKGPLLYLLNGIGLLVADFWGVWLIEMTFLLGTVWLAYVVVRANFGPDATLFPIAVFLGYFGQFVQGGNFTEQYALLFQFLSIYLFTRIERGDRRAWLPLSIGMLAAIAFFLRPNLVGLWIAIGLYWVLFNREEVTKRILWAGAGAGLVVLAAIGGLASVGGLQAFYDAVFTHNFAHSDVALLERLRAIWRVGGDRMTLVLLPMIAGWCAGVYWLLADKVEGRWPPEDLVKLALLLLPIEIVLVTTSGFGFPHYFLAMLPVVTLLMGFFTWGFVRTARLPGQLMSAILLLCIVLYFVPVELNDFEEIVDKYTRDEGVIYSGHTRTADWIRGQTSPEETILVWGFEPQLYLFSGRNAPTRYFEQHALFVQIDRRDIFEEFLSDVRKRPPALIIDERDGRLPPLDPVERENWEISSDRYTYLPERYQPFLDFVSDQFEFKEVVERYAIYRMVE